MASFRKKSKVWYYRFVDADGVKRERKGCPDRRATEDMARAAETEAAQRRAGLIDPKHAALLDHEGRPLADHLADWQADMVARGSTPAHATLAAERMRRLVAVMLGADPVAVDGKTMTRAQREVAARIIRAGVASARLPLLSTDRVQAGLARYRDAGRSLQTCNHYRAAARAFARWAWKGDRLREDPLRGLTGYNAQEDRRHDRRTLSVEDLRRLIEAAHAGPAYRSMPGLDRALCYRLAVATGLRYAEIGSITPASFSLEGDHPAVVVRAAYAKNGREATLPLPPDLTAEFAGWLAGRPAGDPIFNLPEKGVAMLRRDLEAAGIPYRDAAGLVFDFHALRCQCATLADAAGVSPRVVQRLMRHSTLELTGRYTRPRLVDIEGAASALPSLRPTPPKSHATAATGTDGRRISDPFSPHLPTGGGGSGREPADAGERDDPTPAAVTGTITAETPGLDGSGRELAGGGGSTPDWIRTSNLRFRRPKSVQQNTIGTPDLRVAAGPSAPHLPTDSCPTDPGLALVIDCWSELPEAIRAAVVALVQASGMAGPPRKKRR